MTKHEAFARLGKSKFRSRFPDSLDQTKYGILISDVK